MTQNDCQTRNPASVPCCPQLEPCEVCDTLNFDYRLPFHPVVLANDKRQAVQVEVTLHFRLTRCSGPLSLGDVMYSTTLLPGEKVHLQSSDRHTRFSYDSETKLSYRNEATSEESYYAAGMAHGMSNLSMLDTTNSSAASGSLAASSSGGAGIDLGFISIGGSASGSAYGAYSTSALAHQLTQHAESLHQHMEVSTRAVSSTSIGEVATRSHQQGESDDQYEASSRVFSNPNRCHAITFIFYRINKCQTVRFELVSITRRVDDPAAPTGVVLNPPNPSTGVAVHPSAVLATSANRLEVARRVQESLVVERSNLSAAVGAMRYKTFGNLTPQEAIAADAQKAALRQVDHDLIAEGLLDKSGQVSADAVKKFSWEKHLSLPTPGVMVKGCLDDCCICEPELKREIELDLAKKDLENQLLKRQIELLEQSQQYRCCPGECEAPAAP